MTSKYSFLDVVDLNNPTHIKKAYRFSLNRREFIPHDTTQAITAAYLRTGGSATTIQQQKNNLANHPVVICTYINSDTEVPDDVTELRFDISVTTIHPRAFFAKKKLTTIVAFPPNLQYIFEWAFFGCTSLTSIPNFPDSLRMIGRLSFSRCRSLTSIPPFPKNNLCILSSAFRECTALTSIPTFPYNIRDVDSSAFDGCSSLTDKRTIDKYIAIINQPGRGGWKKRWLKINENQITVKLCLERLHSDKVHIQLQNKEINELTDGEFAFMVIDMMKNSGWYDKGDEIVNMTGEII